MTDRDSLADHGADRVHNKAADVDGAVLQVGSVTGGLTVNLPARGTDPAGPATESPAVDGTSRPGSHKADTTRWPRVLAVALAGAVVGVVIWQLVVAGAPPSQDHNAGAAPTSESRSSAPSPSGTQPAAPSTPGTTAPAAKSAPAKPQPGRGTVPAPPGDTRRTVLTPGSDSRLQNASTNQCVSGDSFFPDFGTCSGNRAYTWTLRPSGGDTFELVNSMSGNCLSAPYANDDGARLDPCGEFGGTGFTSWRIGQTTAAGQTLENTDTRRCLAIGSQPFGGGNSVMVSTCNSQRPQQLWRNGEA